MTRADKMLAGSAGGEMIAGVVIVTGLAAAVGSAGWQVFWLIALVAAGGLRRFGRRLADTMRPPGVPQGPQGPGGD